MLHLFGDTDSACSQTGIRRWLKSLKWPVTKPWEPWIFKDEFIGYRKEYDNFAFITIYGEGHMAIFNKPEPVQDIVMKFLESNGTAF